MSAYRLPTEVWRSILRQTTYVPELLSTTWDYDPEERIWQGWDNAGSYESGVDFGLHTKRSVVQVCREWRDIGTEFLYEAIQIPAKLIRYDGKQVEELIEVLAASAAGSSTGYGYGWWVKRIQFSGSIVSTHFIERLLSLLQQCHNLKIIVALLHNGISPSEAQTRLLRFLGSHFSHSLRRVELYVNVRDGPYPDVIPGIIGLTSIGVIVWEESPELIDQSAFEHITALTIYLPAYLDIPVPLWTFPALKTLSIQNMYDQDVDYLAPFVERHQSTLVHLHISTTWGRSTRLPLLLSNAPQIHSLTLDKTNLEALQAWRNSHQVFDSLTHLGVTRLFEIEGSPPSAWTQESLRRLLEDGIFPNLKAVYFLSETAPFSYGIQWQDIIERFTRQGIRLENRLGCIIGSQRD